MIDPARLEYIEEGRGDPTLLELDLLASRFGLSLDYLVSGTFDATHPDHDAGDAQERPGRARA